MQQNIKDQWTAALRSGEYQQGTGALRNSKDGENYQHCCLGVLCDLYAKNVEATFWDTIEDAVTDFLPKKVANWAGLPSKIVRVYSPGTGVPTRVASLNDAGTYDFNKLADIIDTGLYERA